MSERKEQLKEVFADTQQFYNQDQTLVAAVEYGRKHTKLYVADDYPVIDDLKARDTGLGSSNQNGAEIRVTKHSTLEAAVELHKEFPDKKIAVLNFASASRPGGGVKNGASAQEESLCRCSTLYPTIDRRWLWDQYYDMNRAAKNVIHTDACIYSPGVVICKTDESIPQRLLPEDFVTVDVISCAAPNLRKRIANKHNPEAGKPVTLDYQQQLEIHLKRAKHILHVAVANKVDILVLGAFGCGAFQNDPESVARAYRSALVSYIKSFDVVEFAIYCKSRETNNYLAFCKMFSGREYYGKGHHVRGTNIFRSSNGIIVDDTFWESVEGKELTEEETHAAQEWKNH